MLWGAVNLAGLQCSSDKRIRIFEILKDIIDRRPHMKIEIKHSSVLV